MAVYFYFAVEAVINLKRSIMNQTVLPYGIGGWKKVDSFSLAMQMGVLR